MERDGGAPCANALPGFPYANEAAALISVGPGSLGCRAVKPL